MNLETAIALIGQFANIARMAIAVGENAAPHIANIIRVLKGDTLTPEEREDARQKENELRTRLQEPLPEEE